jgi:TRAP transporter TAXI family solute receptor
MKLGIKLGGLALALALAGASMASAQTVGIGVGAPGFWTNGAGAAVAKVANDAGVKMRIEPASGTTVYVPQINNGQMEFGLANHSETYDAVHGSGLWEGKKLTDLRVISVLAPLRTGIFVKKDSPIRKLSDLKGKRLTTDYSAQKTVQYNVLGMLAMGGLTLDDVEQVKVPNVVRGATDFAAGKADAFFFALGAGKVTETDAAVGGLRILPIDPSPKGMANIRKYIPVGYPDKISPAPGLAGVVEPTTVFAYDYLALASTKTPDDMVYKVVKAMHGGKAAMAAAFKSLEEFDPAKMVKDLGQGIEYHPGAIKYYKEIGAWPPKSS